MTPEPPEGPQRPDLSKNPPGPYEGFTPPGVYESATPPPAPSPLEPGYRLPGEYDAAGQEPPGHGLPGGYTPHGATSPPPAIGGIPQGIPPEPYAVPHGQYQAYPGAYGPYGHVPPQGPPTNVLAIISLIASIVACGVGSIAGVICGHIALHQIRRTGESGRGLAIAGLIIGYLGLLAIVLMFALVIFAGLWTEGSSEIEYGY
ncbi:hypothetical protein GCM10027589_41360 [Actinocorallia lasiicapitis]